MRTNNDILPYLILLLLFFLLPAQAFAHVGYVLSKEEVEKYMGPDLEYLLSPFSDPVNIGLMMGTVVVLLVLYGILPQISFLRERVHVVRKKCHTYIELIPWMLRLSLGIALIGAGISEVLISPNLANFPYFSDLQIMLGFLMMCGILLGPVTWVVLGIYAYSVYLDPYMLGNIEFAMAALALLAFSSRRPGIDDLLDIPFFLSIKSLKPYVPMILRFGMGAAMMFLAVYEKLYNPHLSALVVQQYRLNEVVPVSPEMWVLSAGLIEFAIGLFLLIGFHVRLVSVIAFTVLSLSFFYFGEEVYSHITLFGVLSVLVVFGNKAITPRYERPEC